MGAGIQARIEAETEAGEYRDRDRSESRKQSQWISQGRDDPESIEIN